MFFDPVQQTKFFSSMSRLALVSATSSAMATTSMLSQTFGAVSEAYSEKKKKPAAKKSKKAASAKTSKTKKAQASTPNFVEDMIDFAFAPMTIAMEAFTPEKDEPVEKTPSWPMPAWTGDNPFFSSDFKPEVPAWMTQATQAWMTPAWMTGKQAMPFAPFDFAKPSFPMMPDYFSASMKSPFEGMPWMAMFGMKRERSAWEKMTDPFEVGSNVVQFPGWNASTSSRKGNPMMQGAFDPTKVAAGMAAMFMVPQFLQAAGSSPWAAFGA